MSRQAFHPGTEEREPESTPASPPPVPEPPDRSLVVALQRSAGNAVVQRYLDDKTTAPRGLARTAFTTGDRVTARMTLEPAVRSIQRIDDTTLEGRYEQQQAETSKSKTAGRTLSWMTMKRKHIHLTGDDKYGHWWTEMDGSESYGWWPKYPVGGIWETLTGVDGELNGQTSFGGTATTDPHHGDSAEDTFSPTYSGALTDDEVRDEVRKHATGYSGSWRWTFGFGQNCHTFQKAMMAKIGLVEP